MKFLTSLVVRRLVARGYRRTGPKWRPFMAPESPKKTGHRLDKILHRLIRQQNLPGCHKIVKHVVREGMFLQHPDLAIMVIELYGKHKWIDEARLVFSALPRPNTVAWHFIVKAHVQVGDVDGARHFYNQIPAVSPNTRNMMISAYIQADRMAEAKKVYDKGKDPPEMVTWCIMFSGLVKNGDLRTARTMLSSMPRRIDVAWNAMLQAYLKKGYLQEAKETFKSMPYKNVLSYRMMVYVLARAGELKEARELLKEMEELDPVIWNEMVQAYAENGHLREAFNMVKTLRSRTTADSFISLLQANGRGGNVEMAKDIYDTLDPVDARGVNSMITAYARNGHIKEAMSLFCEMEDRSQVTWNNMILGCAQHNHLRDAKRLFDESPYECLRASIELIAAYTRAGDMQQAEGLFKSLNLWNNVTWTVMIGGYALNGKPHVALDFFHEMLQGGMSPDGFTFVAVLTACRYVGEVSTGRICFVDMIREYEITPGIEHYHCMMEVLGEAGQLKQAEELLNSMPFVPEGELWTSLLGFCNRHGDFTRGRRAAKRAHPQAVSPYVTLSSRVASESYVEEKSSSDCPSLGDFGMPMAQLFNCEHFERDSSR